MRSSSKFTTTLLIAVCCLLSSCEKKKQEPVTTDTTQSALQSTPQDSGQPGAAPPSPTSDASNAGTSKPKDGSNGGLLAFDKPAPTADEDTSVEVRAIDKNSPEGKALLQSFPKKGQIGDKYTRLPVGAMPILTSSQLFTLQPQIDGFVPDQSLVFKRDVDKKVSKSVQVYRDLNEPSHTIRCTLVDQNEKTAGVLIKSVMDLRQNGGEMTQMSPDGEMITAYLVEFNNMVGVVSYVSKRQRSVLNLLVGDHRLVQLSEEPATGRDHIVEIAKNMKFDVKKFETMH